MKKVLLTFTAIGLAAATQAAVVDFTLAPVSGTGSALDGLPVPNLALGQYDTDAQTYTYVAINVVPDWACGGTVTLDGTDPVEVDAEIKIIGYPTLTVVNLVGEPIYDGNHYVILSDLGLGTGGCSVVAAGQIFFDPPIVPEPHEYAMLAGLGLFGFAAYRRLKA